MIEIVVNVLFRLLLLRCFSRRLLLLLGIHLRMIIVIVMIAMHVVRTAVMMSARMDTRMHARHASRSTSTNCIAANHHWIVAAAAACTHHLAIRQKDIDKEDEHEQYVQQADQYHHKLLAAAAVVAHSLLYNRLLHIVGGQHAGLASALHAASHPARVDGFHLKDDIALAKAHLIHILRLVVIDGTINALERERESQLDAGKDYHKENTHQCRAATRLLILQCIVVGVLLLLLLHQLHLLIVLLLFLCLRLLRAAQRTVDSIHGIYVRDGTNALGIHAVTCTKVIQLAWNTLESMGKGHCYTGRWWGTRTR